MKTTENLDAGTGPVPVQRNVRLGYEAEYAEFESARNEAMDEYFAASPQIMRTKTMELVFEGGFRRAWEYLKRPGA